MCQDVRGLETRSMMIPSRTKFCSAGGTVRRVSGEGIGAGFVREGWIGG